MKIRIPSIKIENLNSILTDIYKKKTNKKLNKQTLKSINKQTINLSESIIITNEVSNNCDLNNI